MGKGSRHRAQRRDDARIMITYPGARIEGEPVSIDEISADDTVTVIWPDPNPPHETRSREVPMREFLARMDGTSSAEQVRADRSFRVISLLDVDNLHQWLVTQP